MCAYANDLMHFYTPKTKKADSLSSSTSLDLRCRAQPLCPDLPLQNGQHGVDIATVSSTQNVQSCRISERMPLKLNMA